MDKRPKATPKQLEILARRAHVQNLRLQGMTERAIAEKVGVVPSVINADLKAIFTELKNASTNEAATWRVLLSERLEGMIAVLTPMVAAGDLAAMTQYLKVIERLAKLWGADMPVEVKNNTIDGGAMTVEFRYIPPRAALEAGDDETD
jgi:hypothetical protein